MCTGINGKELTLHQIIDRLKDKKILLQKQQVAKRVIYSRQEIDSARTVLDRLLVATNSGDTTTVHHQQVRG